MPKRYQNHTHGDLGEILAAKYLLAQGYWVYFPFSDKSPADIIAIKPGETLMYDIKVVTRRNKDGSVRDPRRLTANQEAIGVKLLYITLDGEILNEEPAPVAAVVKGKLACLFDYLFGRLRCWI